MVHGDILLVECAKVCRQQKLKVNSVDSPEIHSLRILIGGRKNKVQANTIHTENTIEIIRWAANALGLADKKCRTE